ncbi:MAG TPA: hypothetical protein DCE42_16100 [Myxococcales bacterium]|nr:hypothetical protein [Deltaproteobacteria bacterium]MBU54004.1 hypothetical protein [Deltaproteobacteria bacterium]HAA56287.1 hypothetical protein [Myxococcales bacterium]|tara:strand:+ start:8812 stop:9360 length:549 start_codon:yes stop_codon:yes gene_type:complete
MRKQSKQLLLLNIIGGIAVLGSYVYGFMGSEAQIESIWGGISSAMRPYYKISMLTAAAGYFPFTLFFLWRAEDTSSWLGGKMGGKELLVLYALMLFPSALWLPVTFVLVASPSFFLWLSVCIILATVGLASLGLLLALLTWRPGRWDAFRVAAVIGCVAFCVQTVLFDAIIWMIYFPTPWSS